MVTEGFSVKYPHFQRNRNGRLELVSLVHDKWGGGFFLEFAKCDAGDLHTSWGEIVPEAEIHVAYTAPELRARLLSTANPSNSPKDFFRYETIADDGERCDALVEELASLLPQVLSWFESGAVGPNIAPFLDT